MLYKNFKNTPGNKNIIILKVSEIKKVILKDCKSLFLTNVVFLKFLLISGIKLVLRLVIKKDGIRRIERL